MKSSPILAVLLAVCVLPLSACKKSEAKLTEGGHEAEQRKMVVTSPLIKDVTVTEQYVCQIHSRRHIEVKALETGYLEEIPVKEGQWVKQGDLMFRVIPTLYKARLDSEAAEAQLASIEFENTKKLFRTGVVSDQEVALAQAKLNKAEAQVKLAQAELNFTEVKAPFDGLIDRLHEQQGSLVEEGAMLTSLSDNGVMWVYFNVPEARYLEYKANLDKQDAGNMQIELMLANAAKFEQSGKIGAIESVFNNETGNIAFRADFPNPDGLLRHGQTGSVLIHRIVHSAAVIPQRATFDILDKKFVFIVGDDGIAHQHEVKVGNEMEDIYVVKEGVKPGDKIVLEGVREVREGEKMEFEFRDPAEVLGDLKNKAE